MIIIIEFLGIFCVVLALCCFCAREMKIGFALNLFAAFLLGVVAFYSELWGLLTLQFFVALISIEGFNGSR